MERCIKFRAKDKFTDKWVFGDFTHSQKVTETGLEPCVMVGGYEVIEDTVGQFTGLKDKNGNDIYEGDLLSYRLEIELLVIFKHGSFGFYDKTLDMYIVSNLLAKKSNLINMVEVIGNIYDTTEFLK